MEHAAVFGPRRFPGEMGALAMQQQNQLEAKSRERRRFKTLKEYSEATGQDRHSVMVDYDVFQKVTPPGPICERFTSRRISISSFVRHRPRWTLRVRLTGVNDDFTGRAPDLGHSKSAVRSRTTDRENKSFPSRFFPSCNALRLARHRGRLDPRQHFRSDCRG